MPVTEVISFVFHENATVVRLPPIYVSHQTYNGLIGSINANYRANGYNQRRHVDVYYDTTGNCQDIITRRNYGQVMNQQCFNSWLDMRRLGGNNTPEE
jgi:hypothetical protein